MSGDAQRLLDRLAVESGRCGRQAFSLACAEGWAHLADIFELGAKGFRTAVAWIAERTVRYFIVGLAVASYVGAAFLKDLVLPDEGEGQPWFIWAAGATVVVTVFTLILQFRDSRLIGKLRNDNERLRKLMKGLAADYNEVWNTVLRGWAEDLELDGNDRISIYQHDGAGFTMLGRYSSNTAFSAKGRVIYPTDQGCIGDAWRSGLGQCFANDFPDPAVDMNAYAAHHATRWGLTDAEARALVMKSRSFFAAAVTGRNGQRHAIVVFESLSGARLKQRKLASFMTERGSAEVNEWMVSMSNQLPSIVMAREEGL